MTPIPLVFTAPAVAFEPSEEQRAVIAWERGPALVASSAGSGKTACLVARIVRLVRETGVAPEATLTLTYNREAAELLRRRLAAQLGPALADRLHVHTFHAFAYALVRAWFAGDAAWAGMKLDASRRQTWRIAQRSAESVGLVGDARAYLQVADILREWALDLYAPDAPERVARLPFCEGDLARAGRLLQFVRTFQDAKLRARVFDFGDMLYGACRLIALRDPRAANIGPYRHVCVDEGQEISRARWALAEAAARSAESFLVVGDARQALANSYSGADHGILLDFAQREGVTVLPLAVNRRSTRAIVALGNRVAKGRAWHLGGDARAREEALEGEAPAVWWTLDAGAEAHRVGEDLQRRLAAGEALVDAAGHPRFACLARTNAQLVVLERALLTAGIACRLRGTPGGVWASSPGQDFRAYLHAIEGRVHDRIAGIANKPNRWLKRAVVEEAVERATREARSLIAVLQADTHRGASKFAEELLALAAKAWAPRCFAVARLLSDDLKDRDQEQRDQQGFAVSFDEGATEEVFRALGQAAVEAGSIEGIEAQVKRALAVGEAPAVVLSTIHAMRGDEAEVVYLCGLAKGVLPHKRSDDEDEERRVFYVAVTRARSKLYLSVGGPAASPFLREAGLLSSARPVTGRSDGAHDGAPGVVVRRKAQRSAP